MGYIFSDAFTSPSIVPDFANPFLIPNTGYSFCKVFEIIQIFILKTSGQEQSRKQLKMLFLFLFGGLQVDIALGFEMRYNAFLHHKELQNCHRLKVEFEKILIFMVLGYILFQ